MENKLKSYETLFVINAELSEEDTKAVVESRDVAVEFYEKLGYTVTDRTIIHGDTFDCIHMEKSLYNS